MTLGEKLALAGGRPSGFDYLRLGLALAVFVWHTIPTTYGMASQAAWNNPVSYSVLAWILPAFFALSGFLVAGSLERCTTLAGFLFLRAIRIYPALIVETVFCAFILGPWLTKLSLRQYFHNGLLVHYMLNCFGYVHYQLPGVFVHLPFPGIVNKQLWTIPFELLCYISVTIIGIIGITHKRHLFVVVVFLAMAWNAFGIHHAQVPGHQVGSGTDLVVNFLFGVLYYSFRDRIPHSRALACVAIVTGVVVFLLPDGQALTAPAVAYFVAFIGLTDIGKPGFLASGADYSYGIYLYSWPIQQAVAMLGLDNGLINLAIAFPPTLLLAAGSWHLWEKRCLEARKYRPKVDRWFSHTAPGKVVGQVYRMAVPAKS